MGQANAARDSLYDLRECKMAGSDASTFDMCAAAAHRLVLSPRACRRWLAHQRFSSPGIFPPHPRPQHATYPVPQPAP